MANFATIIYEKKDKVAWITLNRPEVLNAQNDQLCQELEEVLQQGRDDEEVQVMVITGAGDRAFSAGYDINEVANTTPVEWLKVSDARTRYELIREIPKPIIAMVNGLALGAGCEIALACDMVVASEDARFGQPEIRVGIIPGGGSTQLLPRLIGEKKAKELIFTGRLISAQEAIGLGLINRVVPREKLKKTVEELIDTLLEQSPVILGIAKRVVNKSLELSFSAGLAFEREFLALCFATEDQREATKAFLEKRKPQYKGR